MQHNLLKNDKMQQKYQSNWSVTGLTQMSLTQKQEVQGLLELSSRTALSLPGTKSRTYTAVGRQKETFKHTTAQNI